MGELQAGLIGELRMQHSELMASIRSVMRSLEDIVEVLDAFHTAVVATRNPVGETTNDEPEPEYTETEDNPTFPQRPDGVGQRGG